MSNIVEVGSTVELLDLSNNRKGTFIIGKAYYDEVSVKSDDGWIVRRGNYRGSDSNPENGIISEESPIGRAVLGKSIGEVVVAKIPGVGKILGNDRKFKILGIKSISSGLIQEAKLREQQKPFMLNLTKESIGNNTSIPNTAFVNNNEDVCMTIFKQNQDKIKEIVFKRQIKQLVHFTRMENLDSIKKHGILPKSELKRRGLKCCENDPSRLDYRLDCISLSVSQINEYLISSFARKYGVTDWAILFINPEILYRDGSIAYYCYTNAANTEISRYLRDYQTALVLTKSNMFEGMFRENISYKTSKGEERCFDRKGKCSNSTTDVQAEIMYRGLIMPNDILDTKKYINK